MVSNPTLGFRGLDWAENNLVPFLACLSAFHAGRMEQDTTFILLDMLLALMQRGILASWGADAQSLLTT